MKFAVTQISSGTNFVGHEHGQRGAGLRKLANGRAQADDAPGLGRGHRCVGQIELSRVHLSPIERDRGLVLLDEVVLVVKLLLGDRLALHEVLKAAEICLRLFENRLIVSQLGVGLFERDAIIAIVDAREHVA